MTRYFIIKCASAEVLREAIRNGVWGVPQRRHPPQPRITLLEALTQGDVCFIASVSGSKLWTAYGFLQAVGAERLENGYYDCKVDWQVACKLGLPYRKTDHIRNTMEGNHPLNISRNMQEVPGPVGAELLSQLDETFREEQAIQAAQATLQSQEAKHFFEADGFENNWEPFLAEVAKFGRILFAANIGSRAFNLNLPDSDYDMIAIVVCETGELLRLQAPPSTVRNADSFKPDFTIHELGYFVQLLMNGDGRIVELLFQPESTTIFASTEWLRLRQFASCFLGKAMVEKYCSELEGPKGIRLVRNQQAEKGFLLKKYYIFFRLLHSIQMVMKDKFFVFFPDDDPHRQRIMAIRRGECEPADLLPVLETEFTETCAAVAAWTPARPDPKQQPELIRSVQEWMLSVRGLNLRAPLPAQILESPRVYVQSPTERLDPLCSPGESEGLELSDFCFRLARGDAKLVSTVFRLPDSTPHFQSLIADRDRLLSPKFLKGILRSLLFSLKPGKRPGNLPDREFLAELLFQGAVRNDIESSLTTWKFSEENLQRLCAKFEGFDYDDMAQADLLDLLDSWQISVRLALFPLNQE